MAAATGASPRRAGVGHPGRFAVDVSACVQDDGRGRRIGVELPRSPRQAPPPTEGATMATTVLLPLDGSRFSRQAFRAVGRLFSAENTHVTLLHVAEAPEGVRERTWAPLVSEAWPGLRQGGRLDAPLAEHPIYATQVWESTKAELIEALDDDVRALTDAGFAVRLVIRFGDPAQEIADLIEEDDIDAVVMATHGRSGLSRAIMGSVAERVLRMVHVPVIMIRGREEAGPPALTPLG
jgi:nucleotide-binding universal stress UspA family protein